MRVSRYLSLTLAAIMLLVMLSGCSTVNRLVNLPFKAANNVLNTTEDIAASPNGLSRTLNKGVDSASRMQSSSMWGY
ncbi:MAG TPA: hypothetical protein PLG59_05175 [bacterium]|nr:hypothetical protein [bacterium]HQO34028.1 hypothetical protein [bacterium]HQP98289.1 hypothetical protein [bacterium]